jgi:hypothetical protein
MGGISNAGGGVGSSGGFVLSGMPQTITRAKGSRKGLRGNGALCQDVCKIFLMSGVAKPELSSR